MRAEERKGEQRDDRKGIEPLDQQESVQHAAGERPERLGDVHAGYAARWE